MAQVLTRDKLLRQYYRSALQDIQNLSQQFREDLDKLVEVQSKRDDFWFGVKNLGYSLWRGLEKSYHNVELSLDSIIANFRNNVSHIKDDNDGTSASTDIKYMLLDLIATFAESTYTFGVGTVAGITNFFGSDALDEWSQREIAKSKQTFTNLRGDFLKNGTLLEPTIINDDTFLYADPEKANQSIYEENKQIVDNRWVKEDDGDLTQHEQERLAIYKDFMQEFEYRQKKKAQIDLRTKKEEAYQRAGDTWIYKVGDPLMENMGSMLPAIAMTYVAGKLGTSSGIGTSAAANTLKTGAKAQFAAKAYGQAMSEALENGSSMQDAQTYAFGIMATELASEQVFGYKIGEGFSKSLTPNAFARLIKTGFEEATEEVMVEFGQKNLAETYANSDEYEGETHSELRERVGFSALIGGLSGGIFGAGNFIQSFTTKGKINNLNQAIYGNIKENGLESTKKALENSINSLERKLSKDGGYFTESAKEKIMKNPLAQEIFDVKEVEGKKVYELNEKGQKLKSGQILAKQGDKTISKDTHAVGSENYMQEYAQEVEFINNEGKKTKQKLEIIQKENLNKYKNGGIAQDMIDLGLNVAVVSVEGRNVQSQQQQEFDSFVDTNSGISYVNINSDKGFANLLSHEIHDKISTLARQGKLTKKQRNAYNNFLKALSNVNQTENFEKLGVRFNEQAYRELYKGRDNLEDLILTEKISAFIQQTMDNETILQEAFNENRTMFEKIASIFTNKLSYNRILKAMGIDVKTHKALAKQMTKVQKTWKNALKQSKAHVKEVKNLSLAIFGARDSEKMFSLENGEGYIFDDIYFKEGVYKELRMVNPEFYQKLVEKNIHMSTDLDTFLQPDVLEAYLQGVLSISEINYFTEEKRQKFYKEYLNNYTIITKENNEKLFKKGYFLEYNGLYYNKKDFEFLRDTTVSSFEFSPYTNSFKFNITLQDEDSGQLRSFSRFILPRLIKEVNGRTYSVKNPVLFEASLRTKVFEYFLENGKLPNQSIALASIGGTHFGSSRNFGPVTMVLNKNITKKQDFTWWGDDVFSPIRKLFLNENKMYQEAMGFDENNRISEQSVEEKLELENNLNTQWFEKQPDNYKSQTEDTQKVIKEISNMLMEDLQLLFEFRRGNVTTQELFEELYMEQMDYLPEVTDLMMKQIRLFDDNFRLLVNRYMDGSYKSNIEEFIEKNKNLLLSPSSGTLSKYEGNSYFYHQQYGWERLDSYEVKNKMEIFRNTIIKVKEQFAFQSEEAFVDLDEVDEYDLSDLSFQDIFNNLNTLRFSHEDFGSSQITPEAFKETINKQMDLNDTQNILASFNNAIEALKTLLVTDRMYLQESELEGRYNFLKVAELIYQFENQDRIELTKEQKDRLGYHQEELETIFNFLNRIQPYLLNDEVALLAEGKLEVSYEDVDFMVFNRTWNTINRYYDAKEMERLVKEFGKKYGVKVIIKNDFRKDQVIKEEIIEKPDNNTMLSMDNSNADFMKKMKIQNLLGAYQRLQDLGIELKTNKKGIPIDESGKERTASYLNNLYKEYSNRLKNFKISKGNEVFNRETKRLERLKKNYEKIATEFEKYEEKKNKEGLSPKETKEMDALYKEQQKLYDEIKKVEENIGFLKQTIDLYHRSKGHKNWEYGKEYTIQDQENAEEQELSRVEEEILENDYKVEEEQEVRETITTTMSGNFSSQGGFGFNNFAQSMNQNKTSSKAKYKAFEDTFYNNVDELNKVISKPRTKLERLTSALYKSWEYYITKQKTGNKFYNHMASQLSQKIVFEVNALNNLIKNDSNRTDKTPSKRELIYIANKVNEAVFNTLDYVDEDIRLEINKTESNPNGYAFTKAIYWYLRDMKQVKNWTKAEFEKFNKDRRGYAYRRLLNAIVNLNAKNGKKELVKAMTHFFHATNVERVYDVALDSEAPRTEKNILKQWDRNTKNNQMLYQTVGYEPKVSALFDSFTIGETFGLWNPNSWSMVLNDKLVRGLDRQLFIDKKAKDIFEKNNWLKKNYKNIVNLDKVKNAINVENLGNIEIMPSQVIYLRDMVLREIIRNRAIDFGLIRGEKTSHFNDGFEVDVLHITDIKEEKSDKKKVGKVTDPVSLFNELNAIIENDAFMKEYNTKVIEFFNEMYPYVNERYKEINGVNLSNDGMLITEKLNEQGNAYKEQMLDGLSSTLKVEDIANIYIPFLINSSGYFKEDKLNLKAIMDLGVFDGMTKELGSSNSRVEVDSITNVFRSYSREVANFYGLHRIMTDLNMVLNERLEGYEQETFVNRNIPDKVIKFYTEMLKDMAGYRPPAKHPKIKRTFSWFRRNFYRASLGLNLKVIGSQVTTMFNLSNLYGNEFHHMFPKMAKNFYAQHTKTNKQKIKYLEENNLVYVDRKKVASFEIGEATTEGFAGNNKFNRAIQHTMDGIRFTDASINRALYLTLLDTINPETQKKYTQKEASDTVKMAILRSQSSTQPLAKASLLRSDNEIVRIMVKFLGEPMKLITQVYNSNRQVKFIKLLKEKQNEVNEKLDKAVEVEQKKYDKITDRLTTQESIENSDGFVQMTDKEQKEVHKKVKELRKEQEAQKYVLDDVIENRQRVQKQIKETIKSEGKAKQLRNRRYTAFVVATLYLTMLRSGFELLRSKGGKKDKPEDEAYMAYLTKMLTKNFTDTLFGMFPFVRDAYSTISSGWGFNDIDELSSLNDLAQTLNYFVLAIASGKEMDVGKTIRNLSMSAGQVFGVPVRQFERLITTPLLYIDETLHYKYHKYTGRNVSSNKELKMAIENGDDRMIETIITSRMNDRGVTVSDRVSKEFIRLASTGYDANISGVNDSYTVNGVEYELTKSQKRKFAKIYNQADYVAQKIIRSPYYKRLNDDMKQTLLKSIYNYYYRLAKQEVLDVEIIPESSYLRNLNEAYRYFTERAESLYKKQRSRDYILEQRKKATS